MRENRALRVADGSREPAVVATTVTDNASDQGQLIPMVDAVRDAFGETPEQVLADAGYCNEPNLQALKERNIDGYVSLAREGTAVVDPDPDKYPAKAVHGPRSWRVKRAENGTHAASGWRRRPSAGSRR